MSMMTYHFFCCFENLLSYNICINNQQAKTDKNLSPGSISVEWLQLFVMQYIMKYIPCVTCIFLENKPLCGLWDIPCYTPQKHCITSIYQLIRPDKIKMVFTSKIRSLRTSSALGFFDLRDIWQLVLPLVGEYSLSLSSFFVSAVFCRPKNDFVIHRDCHKHSHLLTSICPGQGKQHYHILW